MDRVWWKQYYKRVCERFKGERMTLAGRFAGVTTARIRHPKNSGAGAIKLANFFGAKRIILLGFDCQYTDGKKHWHGDHPKGLGNAVSMPKWFAHFEDLAKELSHCEIINATRSTALKFWPKQSLEKALNLEES